MARTPFSVSQENVTGTLSPSQELLDCPVVGVKDVPPLDSHSYVPRGTTAFLDAIGRTINTIGERLDKTPESDRPGKVIVAILTDGLENASQEFKRKEIFRKCRRHEHSETSALSGQLASAYWRENLTGSSIKK
jgi:hypothetical protein